MNYFESLKKKDLLDVVAEGMKISQDKEGFCRFAEDNWQIADGDYVRAVIATAKILKSRSFGKTHDIHVFEFIFGGVGLETAVEKYFDSDGSLMEEYHQCIENYEEMDALYTQLQKVTRYEYSPLIKNINFCKLMDYQNKKVIMSTIYGDQITDKKECKLRMYGASPRYAKVRVDGKILPLVGIKNGVIDIRDPETLEMLYQNHYLTSDKFSSVQRAGFVFGSEEAVNEYANKVREISSRSSRRPQVNSDGDREILM